MMKVLIIEDEQLAAQKLSRLLKEIVPDIEIMETIPSVEKAVNFFSQYVAFELVFMDIQLEDGICFEIFEKLKIDSPIIFTTAFDEYTLKAFKQNSVDYLLKPIKKEELKNAINKYENIHQKVNASTLQRVINDLKSNEYKERFLIKVGEHFKSIEINRVNCFYIKEKYCFLNTADARSYGIDYSLEKVESFINAKDFFRINRNYIVRFSAINEIIAYSSSRLKIKLHGIEEFEDILVSRERVAEFKKWMDR